MANFNMGALSDWETVEPGEVRVLDIGAAGFRRVDLDLMSDAPISVYAVREGQPDIPVAVGEGLLSSSFTAVGDVSLLVLAHADANIRLRSKVRSQKIAESDEPSYTTIEPRPAGPSDEVRRMMRLMNLNHERRMAELKAEIARMRPAEAQARVAEVIEEDGPSAPAAEQEA